MQSLSNLRRSLDLIYYSLSTHLHSLSPLSPVPAVLSRIAALLTSAEAALTHHTERIGIAYLDHPQLDSRAGIYPAQGCFLKSLRLELKCLGAGGLAQEMANHPTSPLHPSNSLRLQALEAYPRWLETALTAAHQHAASSSAPSAHGGGGPLASVGFGWEELKMLRISLRAAGMFSGLAQSRVGELERGLAGVGFGVGEEEEWGAGED